MARGFAQSGVRIANERTIMTLIALNPGASNADLARLSGLGPQTTSRIVVDLETRALVLRGEVLRGRRGQPATPLFLNPDGAFAIGVEIGWRHFEVLLFRMAGQTLASIRRSYAWPDFHTIFVDVAAEIATIRAGMTEQQAGRLTGIGLATPSNIARHLGRVGAPAEQVELWRTADPAAELAQAIDQPVEWFNDGNAGCWAEFLSRPEPRPSGLAYFQVGTMVGAGVAIDGQLWQGRTGNAANLGAILVPDIKGQPNYVHTIASILALQQRLEAAGTRLPPGDPMNWDWASLEPVAGAWLDDAGRALAGAVLNTRAVMELDLAIIDGVMPRPVVRRLFERVQHHLAAMPHFRTDRPAVVMGHLGGGAAAAGAAQLLLFHRFFSRAWNIFAT
ncbi:ROK family transcriptional regulator [Devosia ginsengisoli]|uniref:ROK family transcriptional regulator n=1 Tax=Devosia ginsengisoli TaxID=400770 RepID=UPI0026EB59B4|nr:ROK family transcriptional regulator [Devosia ginsengisoli]MCR6669884.1 ROK family transcriptional regulator [Devosia ginsengisoli]